MYSNKLIGGNMRLSMKAVVGIVSLMFIVAIFAGPAYAGGKANSLVETKWLADNLSSVKVVFVENWPSEKEIYMKRHIKGSTLMTLGELMGTLMPKPPSKEKFTAAMNKHGISNNDHVVFYGATAKNVFTLSAVWLMDYFKHNNVSYLNGGLAKWNKENLPGEAGMTKAEPASYKVGSTDESIRISAEDVLKKLDNPNAVIVDARGTEFYTGKTREENVPRVGHIPGALDLDAYLINFNQSDGTVKPAADLMAFYESKGVTKDKEVIVYCQAGVKAGNAYYIFKHILGYPNVKNYVGSWKEWSKQDFNKYPIVGKIVEEKKK